MVNSETIFIKCGEYASKVKCLVMKRQSLQESYIFQPEICGVKNSSSFSLKWNDLEGNVKQIWLLINTQRHFIWDMTKISHLSLIALSSQIYLSFINDFKSLKHLNEKHGYLVLSFNCSFYQNVMLPQVFTVLQTNLVSQRAALCSHKHNENFLSNVCSSVYFKSILKEKNVPRDWCNRSICRRRRIRDVAIQLSQIFHKSALFFTAFGAFLLLWVVFSHLVLSLGNSAVQNPNPLTLCNLRFPLP